MKEKIHYVIEGMLAVAVIFLFVLYFSGDKESSKERVIVSGDDTNVMQSMPIAYIDIDSLTKGYNYAIDLNEQIQKKIENSRADLAVQARRLQSEMDDFQRKYETQSFLSQERQDREIQNIRKKQEDYQQLEVRLTQEIEAFQIEMMEKLRSTIITQVEIYNKEKGYHFIHGKSGENILYADKMYNITADFIEYLNRQYTKSE